MKVGLVPYKDRVRDKTREAIRTRKLVRQPCEVCGITGEDHRGHPLVQAHHDTYDYARALEVRWLCFRHHREFHRRDKPSGCVGTTKAGTACRVPLATETRCWRHAREWLVAELLKEFA